MRTNTRHTIPASPSGQERNQIRLVPGKKEKGEKGKTQGPRTQGKGFPFDCRLSIVPSGQGEATRSPQKGKLSEMRPKPEEGNCQRDKTPDLECEVDDKIATPRKRKVCHLPRMGVPWCLKTRHDLPAGKGMRDMKIVCFFYASILLLLLLVRIIL